MIYITCELAFQLNNRCYIIFKSFMNIRLLNSPAADITVKTDDSVTHSLCKVGCAVWQPTCVSCVAQYALLFFL